MSATVPETKKFTKKQLEDYVEFEFVRSSGRWNMFDPMARKASGLTSDEYRFVMKNYSALRAQSLKEQGE